MPNYTNEAVSSRSGNARITNEASLEAQNLGTGAASASHAVLQTYGILAHSVSGFDVIEPGFGYLINQRPDIKNIKIQSI